MFIEHSQNSPADRASVLLPAGDDPYASTQVEHDFLTVSEAANRLRRCEKTIRRYCSDGRLGHLREETGRILVPLKCIEAYLDSCFVPVGTDETDAETFEIKSRSQLRLECPEVRSVVDYDNRIFDGHSARGLSS